MKLFELTDDPVKAWAIAPSEKVLGCHESIREFFANTSFENVIIRELTDDEPLTMSFFDNGLVEITHTAKEWCAIYGNSQNEIIGTTEY